MTQHSSDPPVTHEPPSPSVGELYDRIVQLESQLEDLQSAFLTQSRVTDLQFALSKRIVGMQVKLDVMLDFVYSAIAGLEPATAVRLHSELTAHLEQLMGNGVEEIKAPYSPAKPPARKAPHGRHLPDVVSP